MNSLSKVTVVCPSNEPNMKQIRKTIVLQYPLIEEHLEKLRKIGKVI